MGDGYEMGLATMDLKSLTPKSYRWRKGFDIVNFKWVGNKDVLFNVVKWNSYAAGLYRVNCEKKKISTLLDNKIVAKVIDPMVKDSKFARVWVPSQYEGKPSIAKLLKYESARSLNPGSNRLDNTKVLREAEVLPTGNCGAFKMDHNHEFRIFSYADPKGNLMYMHRPSEKEDWEPMELNPEKWGIVRFDRDNKTLYVTGYGDADTKGLYTYDMETNTIGDLIFRDDYYDFSATARYKFFKGSLIGVTYERNAPASVWFLPQMNQIQGFIDKKLPGRANVISNWNQDMTSFLIHSHSDTSPISYLTLNLKTKEFKLVSKSAPWIDDSESCPTQVLRFNTSDDLKLEAYVTTPKKGTAPYPTVCLVHGGPWVRDRGGFNREAQFFASLGYAVVRVNYRGSSGYGKTISNDQFDFLAMSEDVTRANQILIKNGTCDPDRMAIMGTSFGGFAALAGAAYEPDMYQCAVTMAGVFDWEEIIKAAKRDRHTYWYKKLVKKLGDPKNKEAFDEISPINHVDKVKIPVFIGHGKSDRVVSIQQSKKLASELKKNDIPVETFYRSWEGHGFMEGENRIAFYKEVEAFFAKYL